MDGVEVSQYKVVTYEWSQKHLEINQHGGILCDDLWKWLLMISPGWLVTPESTNSLFWEMCRLVQKLSKQAGAGYHRSKALHLLLTPSHRCEVGGWMGMLSPLRASQAGLLLCTIFSKNVGVSFLSIALDGAQGQVTSHADISRAHRNYNLPDFLNLHPKTRPSCLFSFCYHHISGHCCFWSIYTFNETSYSFHQMPLKSYLIWD